MTTKRSSCQEVHHRVGNDLQTVAGLVFLQLQHCDSQEAKAVLTDTMMRIRSVAIVHQLLSKEQPEVVRVGHLAEKIMETAIRASGTGRDVPTFTVTGDEVSVGPKRATHIAIVLNELIANSLTRGSNTEAVRRLRCSVRKATDNGVVLEFADDGNNFAERFDVSKDSNLGLQIAFDIVKEDLDGCMEVIPGAGAHVRISFKN